jgi:hypothetical protein
MITFTWKYGKEPFLFEEMFDEQRDSDDILDHSREDNTEENNKEDDFESEDRLKTPSKYLFDIHLLKLMKNAISTNEYNITNRDMHLYYEVVQKYLAYNKGILVSIAKTTHSETEDVNLRNNIYRFIDDCRIAWRDGESFDEIRRDFPGFFGENSPYQDEIIAIENYFSDRSHRTQPYYLYEKLVQKISPLMKERRQLVRMSKHIFSYTYMPQRHNGRALTCQMILDDAYYLDFIEPANDHIASLTTETINAYLASSSIDEVSFKESVNHMVRHINSCDELGNHMFGRFIGNKKGCFCIFDISSDEYISLSGPFDITDSAIERYFGYSSDKKRSNKDLMDKINNIILADPTLHSSKYANLNLLTRRYPYTKGSGIPSNGETVEDAMKRRIDKNEIQGDYSCCERKIFSCINANNSGQCYMFTRHKPCPKCIPAIKEFLHTPGRQMRIFYYENDSVEEFDMSTI